VKAAARALELISPNPEQRDLCATAIDARIQMLRGLARDIGSIPSPGDLKGELKEIVRDLKRTKRNFTKYSEVAKAATFWKDPERQEAFLTALNQGIEAAQFHHDALVIPPGSRQFDNVKAMAASYAAELLRCYSAEPLTPTGRICRELAELLYKEATGKAANLEPYCRQPGRIEPRPLFRVPFAKRR